MNRSYLAGFLELYSYPEEACRVLVQALDRLEETEELCTSFEAVLAKYKAERDCDFAELLSDMKALSQKASIHEYTGYLLLFICMSRILRKYYEEAGIPGKVFETSMCDLKWKLMECKSVQGVWGTFVPTWYRGFFQMQLFGFEKLQFECKPFRRTYQKAGVELVPESIVLNTHIPRTGTKLDRESLIASYKEGAAFFRKYFQLEEIVFVCSSWLLFPRNREILSSSSNLLRFVSDFDIVESGEYENYDQIWRLFDVKYDGNVDHLPQDTSFRRGYADWIRKGEKTGWGYGVYVYKEE